MGVDKHLPRLTVRYRENELFHAMNCTLNIKSYTLDDALRIKLRHDCT